MVVPGSGKHPPHVAYATGEFLILKVGGEAGQVSSRANDSSTPGAPSSPPEEKLALLRLPLRGGEGSTSPL
jgi:hypothetical protein